MREEWVGSSDSGPKFPRRGEQWFECYICGFDFPRSEGMRHYRTNRLVDIYCNDEKTHTDYLAEMVPPKEEVINVEQPVTCQGEAVDDAWYGAQWYDGEWYGEGHACEEKP